MTEDIRVVNLAEKFAMINGHYQPKIVGQINDTHVKIVKIKGEFEWHHHDTEDEMFLVIKGTFKMHLRDKLLIIREGEFVIIPHGVEHKPDADDDVWIMLIEPVGTLNTGTVQNERTVIPETI